MRTWWKTAVVAASVALAAPSAVADTPGEEAVKDAVRALKAKRAQAKDKGDQTLLDAAVKDLEDRLAQVGKGEPVEDNKVEPFAMPVGWELRLNTGRNRPTFDPKTGVMKLIYDFADPKQLKDFEYDKDAKPTVQKGTLAVGGGEEVRHVVKFKTLTASFTVVAGNGGDCVATTGGTRLQLVVANGPNGFQLHHGNKMVVFDGVRTGDLRKRPVPVKEFFVTDKRCGVTVDGTSGAGAVQDGQAGQLVFRAKQAPNTYTKVIVSGTLDSEWAKEFFADKK